ncbi:MAG TPA: hypothetical protein VM165_11275, partial [Planctomycetaceae bacterium]|nr:hypothetical protein [Planctomycetaceae bacterium]
TSPSFFCLTAAIAASTTESPPSMRAWAKSKSAELICRSYAARASKAASSPVVSAAMTVLSAETRQVVKVHQSSDVG